MIVGTASRFIFLFHHSVFDHVWLLDLMLTCFLFPNIMHRISLCP